MIVHQTVFIGLLLFASQSVADICTGRPSGEQFPNPSDCSTFYVCNFGQAKLFDCPGDLLYDASLRSCNWAHMVNCSQVIDNDKPSTIFPYTEQGTNEYATTNLTQTTIFTNESVIEHTPATPTSNGTNEEIELTPATPTFNGTNEEIALLPATTESVIELTPATPTSNGTSEVSPGILEISPNVFHCKDPEFYFAPHPRDCEQYFICENTRIHPYECGNGLYWDYVNNRCNLPLNSLCYPIIPPESKGKLVCSSAGRIAEYKESECRFVSDPKPQPVTEKIIECPESQAFIEDTDDCMKYYICIGGMAISTTCPQKTAWNDTLLQCNEESYKQCRE